MKLFKAVKKKYYLNFFPLLHLKWQLLDVTISILFYIDMLITL